MNNETVLHEITPLSDKDCFYIIERNKTEFTFPLHNHTVYELNYVENARGVRRVVGDSVEEIGDYDLVLITGKDLEHTWQNWNCQSGDIKEITIQFSSDLFIRNFIDKNQFRTIKEMIEKAQKGITFPLSTILKIRPLLRSLSHEEQGFYAVLTFLTILYELSVSNDIRTLSSSSFAQAEQTYDSRRIKKVDDYLNAHFCEEVRLSKVAELVNMSEVSFSRFFKLRTGKSLMDYLIDIRLGHASRYLADSTQTIAEIGYNCGFNNLSNFNRIFRKKKGCTPKEFRENYRKKRTVY
jgi:AraC-like DNA-binding protein